MKQALALALIVLLGGWAWWKAAQPERGPQDLPVWPEVRAQAVQAVEIAREGAPLIRLERRRGDGWRVRTAGKDAQAADAAAVTQLIDDLTAMRPVRVVSRGKRHDRELGLAKGAAVRVRLLGADGALLREVEVGSQASDLISTHVRLGGKGPVVAVDRTLRWQVMRSPRGWRAPEAAKPAASAPKAGKAEAGEGGG